MPLTWPKKRDVHSPAVRELCVEGCRSAPSLWLKLSPWRRRVCASTDCTGNLIGVVRKIRGGEEENMQSLFVAWVVSAVLLALLAVALGVLIGRGYLGILIDNRGRYSLT